MLTSTGKCAPIYKSDDLDPGLNYNLLMKLPFSPGRLSNRSKSPVTLATILIIFFGCCLPKGLDFFGC